MNETRDELAGPTFFERAGGEPGIRAAVTALYERLFDDPMVGFLFAGHDRARIVEQQITFTSRMLGADVAYTGKPLPEAKDPIDFYNPKIDIQELSLGDVSLTPGPHTIRFECTGRNESSKGWKLGIDSVRLRERWNIKRPPLNKKWP